MNWRGLTDRAFQHIRDSFGETVEMRMSGAAPVSIKAVFDNEHQTVDPETRAIISTHQPVLTVRLADLPAYPQENDVVIRNGVSYRVIDTQEDGHGAALLVMHKL